MNAQITRYNPLRASEGLFKQLDELQNRIAASWGFEPIPFARAGETVASPDWFPRVDVSEDDGEFLVKAELPEMRKEDIKVNLEGGVLTISGERKLDREDKKRRYHRIEREYGAFVRSFALPAGATGHKVTAEFKDGVLKVHVPKENGGASARAIEIK